MRISLRRETTQRHSAKRLAHPGSTPSNIDGRRIRRLPATVRRAALLGLRVTGAGDHRRTVRLRILRRGVRQRIRKQQSPRADRPGPGSPSTSELRKRLPTHPHEFGQPAPRPRRFRIHRHDLARQLLNILERNRRVAPMQAQGMSEIGLGPTVAAEPGPSAHQEADRGGDAPASTFANEEEIALPGGLRSSAM